MNKEIFQACEERIKKEIDGLMVILDMSDREDLSYSIHAAIYQHFPQTPPGWSFSDLKQVLNEEDFFDAFGNQKLINFIKNKVMKKEDVVLAYAVKIFDDIGNSYQTISCYDEFQEYVCEILATIWEKETKGVKDLELSESIYANGEKND